MPNSEASSAKEVAKPDQLTQPSPSGGAISDSLTARSLRFIRREVHLAKPFHGVARARSIAEGSDGIQGGLDRYQASSSDVSRSTVVVRT